jgi:hypothetical protein
MGKQEISKTADATSYELILEQLRTGHGLLSWEQFRNAILMHDIDVWALPFNQYALVAWGDSLEGRTLNILTTVGTMEYAAAGLAAIEKLAKQYGAAVVMSVGRVGWTDLVRDAGYTVTPTILMKKVL